MTANLFREIFDSYADGFEEAFRPGYAIAVICGSDSDDNMRRLTEAEQTLGEYVPQSFHLIRGGSIMVFVYGLEDNGSRSGKNSHVTGLEQLSREYSLFCGLSSIFTDLSQRRGFKLQARKALNLGKQQNRPGCVFAADSMYTDILISGAIDRIGRQILELSDIKSLYEHDLKNRTDYLRTLEHYLKHENRLSQAADSMFIDRSTMKYRLKKIKNIMQNDFDEPLVAKRLKLGIYVFRFGVGQ
jgi:DNA-binding PucR family transcriptional regulator